MMPARVTVCCTLRPCWKSTAIRLQKSLWLIWEVHSSRFSISELRRDSEWARGTSEGCIIACGVRVCVCVCFWPGVNEFSVCLVFFQPEKCHLCSCGGWRSSVRVYFTASYFLFTAAAAIHALPRLHSRSIWWFTQSRPLTRTHTPGPIGVFRNVNISDCSV